MRDGNSVAGDVRRRMRHIAEHNYSLASCGMALNACRTPRSLRTSSAENEQSDSDQLDRDTRALTSTEQGVESDRTVVLKERRAVLGQELDAQLRVADVREQ